MKVSTATMPPRSSYDLLEDYVLHVDQEGRSDRMTAVGPSSSSTDSALGEEVLEVLDGIGGGAGGNNGSTVDVDLFIAAEVGRRLLAENEHLSRENRRLAAEYSQKLEHLEQERHTLRRKLETLEGEHSDIVSELQADLSQVRDELRSRQRDVKCSERERLSLVNELSDQNQRLADQLTRATNAEDQLSSQLNHLRDRFNTRRSNINGHVNQLEMLREEFNLIAEKKADLEKTIQSLAEERESISMSLEESTDRIVLLEKHASEQGIKIQNQERDLDELRQLNGLLHERLEVLSQRRPPSAPSSGYPNQPNLESHVNVSSTSLLNEIEMCTETEFDIVATRGDEDENIECDDAPSIAVVPSPLVGLVRHPSEQDNEDEIRKLRQEILDGCVQLRNFCLHLSRRRRASSPSLATAFSSSEIDVSDVKLGFLTDVIKELRAQLQNLLRNADNAGDCGSCGRGPTSEVEDLERDMNLLHEELTRTQQKVMQRTEEGRRKAEQILDLSGRLNMQQIELQHLVEERDLLRQNLRDSGLSSDEIIQKAWGVRDQAIARKNAVEIELAKTRIDVMNVNSQLLEAIQQKLELSQQLEQWQVDMQALLDDQMQRRLIQDEQTQSDDSDFGGGTSGAVSFASTPVKSKLFGLWR